MGKKPASRDEQIYIFADKALKDLGFIAPEDTDMRRTKIYNQMTMLDAPLPTHSWRRCSRRTRQESDRV